jgi:hypothetical protein
VRATNSYGTTYANGSSTAYWTFTTIPVTISGNTGVSGVTLSYTDGTAKTAISDGSGNYSFPVSYNWSGAVTPTKTGYAFTPSNRAYANVTTNQAAQNYSAAAVPVTVTLASTSAQDGWVLESSEASGQGGTMNAIATTFNLGDDATDKQYRAILSFNASLPANAVISSVTLKIKKQGLVGTNPFATLGNILVDIKTDAFSGNNALQIGDFQAASSRAGIGAIKNTPADNWFSLKLPATAFGFINQAGITQFRLRFSKDDNDNLTADFLKFFSGNNSSNKPQLIITYTVP